jgi:hypothetical protein
MAMGTWAVRAAALGSAKPAPVGEAREAGGGRAGGGVGVNRLSPKRLCIYSVLSLCDRVAVAVARCPRREQSAHVGASPPLSHSPGGGGGGGAAKVPVAPC